MNIQALSSRRRHVIYIAALASMFMAVLDMQIVATALPTIADDLGNLDLFGWVGASYLLATAAVTPFYGKLGDLFGRKTISIAAITIFTIGSLACGLAWSMESLIVARILQGLGGGGLMTTAFAIIADLFEPRERAKYQGYSTIVFTLASLTGPASGGLIAQSIGWEYVFLINLPIGIAVAAVLAFAMPTNLSTKRPAIDYLGGLLLAVSVTAIVYWTEEAVSGSLPTSLYVGLPIVAILALAGFILAETKAEEPMLPLSLFTNRTIALSLAISVVVGVCTLGLLNYFALFLQTVTGLPPAYAGLLFIAPSTGSLIASVTSGIIVSRTGRYKIFPVIAMALGTVTLILFSQVSAATPVWLIAPLMFFFASGIGLQMQTLMTAIQNAAPHHQVGAATGAINLARMIGASFGLAVNGGLLNAGLGYFQGRLPPDVVASLPAPVKEMTPEAMQALPHNIHVMVVDVFTNAFGWVYDFGAILFALSFVLALLLKDVRLPVHEKTDPLDSVEAKDATLAPALGE